MTFTELYECGMDRIRSMENGEFSEPTFAEAEDCFNLSIEKATSKGERYAPAYYGIAYSRHLQADYRVALRYIDDAIKMDDSYTEAYLLKARILIKQNADGALEQARAVYRKLRLVEPPTVATSVFEAELLAYEGKPKEARELLLGPAADESSLPETAARRLEELKKYEEFCLPYKRSLGYFCVYDYLTRDILAAAIVSSASPMDVALEEKARYSEREVNVLDARRSVFSNEIYELAKSGYMTADYAGNFYPNKKVLRKDAAVVLAAIMKEAGIVPSDFEGGVSGEVSILDMSSSDKSYDSVEYLVNCGVMETDDSSMFYPLRLMSVVDFFEISARISEAILEKKW